MLAARTLAARTLRAFGGTLWWVATVPAAAGLLLAGAAAGGWPGSTWRPPGGRRGSG
jgi:hypothetical protein